MTRAYVRLDPAFDEHKYGYPDGPYAALIATICLAEHQPERGRFRSVDYLARLLGKRGKHTAYLLDHGDLENLPDGRCYVVGWDEWQEGDWKVGERVARIRARRGNDDGNGSGNGERNAGDNGVDNGPPSEVSAGAGAGAGAGVPSADKARAEQPPALTYEPTDEPEHEALVWLARHGCDIRPGNGYHQKLVTAVEHHGVNAIVGMLDRLAEAGTKPGDTKGFLFGAIDALDSRSRPKLAALQAEDRADEDAAARQRRIEKTRSETAALRDALDSQQGTA